MKYRRLDKNWDYTFGNGGKNYLTDTEAVTQAVKSRLLLLYREWWEDLEDGLPLWERIVGTTGHKDNLQAVDYIFKERIEKTEGVQAILAYHSDFKNRQYRFKAAIQTVYGNVVLLSNDGGDEA